MSTAKHFPGHGDTQGDTHRDIPRVDKIVDMLLKNELLPFQAAIDAGVDIIMTSHILYPSLDSKYPATLSKKILTHLLKEQMKFDGLIITDSMNMGAIRKHYSHAESSIRALEAGAHLIMLSEEHYDHSKDYLQKQIISIESIINAVSKGAIKESIIDERLAKIISYKLAIKQEDTAIKLSPQLLEKHKDLEYKIAQNAIRVLKKFK